MYEEYYKEFYKTFEYLSVRYGKLNVFSDLVKMIAIAIYNSFAKNEEMEKQYLITINKYQKNEQQLFTELFAKLVMMYQTADDIVDILGPFYEKEGLENKNLGQFFTPFHVADMMSEISLEEQDYKRILEKQGFVTMNEPTCGAGRYDTCFCKSIKKT